jgi:hypothetical protein
MTRKPRGDIPSVPNTHSLRRNSAVIGEWRVAQTLSSASGFTRGAVDQPRVHIVVPRMLPEGVVSDDMRPVVGTEFQRPNFSARPGYVPGVNLPTPCGVQAITPLTVTKS